MPSIPYPTISIALAKAETCDECFAELVNTMGRALEATVINFDRARFVSETERRRNMVWENPDAASPDDD
jgi:hypothetical protein